MLGIPSHSRGRLGIYTFCRLVSVSLLNCECLEVSRLLGSVGKKKCHGCSVKRWVVDIPRRYKPESKKTIQEAEDAVYGILGSWTYHQHLSADVGIIDHKIV